MNYPFFKLGQAVAILESCDCKVLEAQMVGPAQMKLKVTWAQDPTIEHISMMLQSYYPESGLQSLKAWSTSEHGVVGEYTEGVYLAEVLGYITRIWATG